nr:GLUG motif-containing protein [Segatella copri]
MDSYFQFSELGGGVCGVNYGTVRDCKNTGSVRGLAAIGGVCGLNEKGGIIENSFNEGTVSGTGDNVQQVGGVCGYNNGTIKSCYNTASVSGQNSVGGVCGFNSRGIITNCFNEGTVSGQTFVGGVCGNGCGVTTTNCFNGGIVSGQSHVSGVCGYDYNYDGTLTNCYYLSDTAKGGINGKDVSGKAEGKSIEQFKSGEVAYLLNGSTSEGELAWYQKLGTDAYPVLTATKGNTVYNGSFRYCDNTATSYSNSTSEDVLVHQMSATLASPEHDADKHIYHMGCRNEGCTLHKYVADMAGNIEVTKDANNKFVATEDLTLADGEDFKDYEPFISKTISYSRNIPEGSTWGTLCLPFAIDQSKETGCKFYRLTGIDNDCITLESYEEGIIPAGTPVLFKMNEGKTSLSLSASNAEIATAPTVAGTNKDVNLVGSFTKIGGKDNQGLDKNDYIIGKNKFWRVSDLNDGNGVGIKPMRAYIHPAYEYLARAAMLSIGKGDGTTAIDNLNAISNDANAEYYDANGRRTNGLQKGLNIVKRGSKTYKIMVK